MAACMRYEPTTHDSPLSRHRDPAKRLGAGQTGYDELKDSKTLKMTSELPGDVQTLGCHSYLFFGDGWMWARRKGCKPQDG